MADIIHLLPDAVANQIAAGEVIQRPASVVKELLENAVDAGADHIQLIVKDAGRTLIQVVDNGKGMSFNDARLCFERHATSKLSTADDLFHLTTKGFRGEALASIAAIAHVELRTKMAEDSTGTLLLIEGSEVKEHAPIATTDGTSISVKNLFFNVPARRNFLKSDSVEFGHIEEEFNRVVLTHQELAFSLYHNGKLVLQLQPSNFMQRIVNVFGAHFQDKLYPVEQQTDFINISGFIAKPENAKKKKSEQYMFINRRYMRHPLLNYAVETAYSELIPDGYKPAYFINLEVDPATIDINISPTKVDVKLQDERLVFGFLNSTVKKSLGQMSLTPRLDFDYEPGMDVSNMPKDLELKEPAVTHNPDFNPFHSHPSNGGAHSSYSGGSSGKSSFPHNTDFDTSGWSDFLQSLKTETLQQESQEHPILDLQPDVESEVDTPVEDFKCLSVNKKFIVASIAGSLSVIHIAHARERILYEQYLAAMQQKPITVQQSLFPDTIALSPAKVEMAKELKPELLKLGYDLEPIDGTHFAVNGTPVDEEEDVQQVIDAFLESYQFNMFSHHTDKEQNMAMSMAKQKCSLFKPMTETCEIKDFLRQLFNCQMSNVSPGGKKIIHQISETEMESWFDK